jgi:conjugative relaxase-like TrwC/TraI family protein
VYGGAARLRRALYLSMLSLWKLRVGAEAYYLSQVARGLDDYYTGNGEIPGQWIGHASPALGLTGEVVPEDLRAVLAGLAPNTGLTPNGEQLRTHSRRVPGFDLTFSVPKSVSVVYALADPIVRQEVIAAGEAALGETIAWLEREACHVRRGTNNRAAKVTNVDDWGTRRLPGAGFVAAAFRHRTSRAGDPQLHWHVLVANMSRGADMRWTALDATSVYRTKRAAGVAFESALRAELTKRLGLSWLPPLKDSADIAGIPSRVLRLFSKRREQIEAELARTGTAGPAAADRATLATRAEKTGFDIEGLEETWHDQAIAIGWGPDQLDALLAATTRPAPEPTTADLVAAVSQRLVETNSTFTRHEISQVIASTMPSGASGERLDQLTSAVIAQSEIIPLGSEYGRRPTGWEQRYTTRSLVDIESELMAIIANRRGDQVAALGEDRIAHAILSNPALGPDQRAGVRQLLSQGNPVEVLVGRAGTGKTFTLATVAAAYRQAGYEVIGVAPSARAARELANGTGIETFTVPRFHRSIAGRPLRSNWLIIVDEAGMCGTLDLHSIVRAARTAGAKTIVVGDHHQLPEVAAGGGFGASVAQLGNQAAELTINRRVRTPWEVDALDELRDGHVYAAWTAYRSHGRVTIGDDLATVRTTAVDDWWHSYHGCRRAFLLAGTRSEANALNHLARSRATAEGMLVGPTLEIHGRSFQAGDRVLLGRNDGRQISDGGQVMRVDNGMLGTIGYVNENGTLSITLDGTGDAVVLQRDYLASGWLDYGYAMTIHKSQGATCDEVFVVGPAGLYREAAYVAMSRARYAAHLYATVSQVAELTELSHSTGLPLPDDDRDPEHELIERIERSEAKSLAITRSPHADAASRLAALPLHVLDDRLHHVRSVEAQLAAEGVIDPDAIRATYERAASVRSMLAVGRRVRALDRDNVGTVESVDDIEGVALVTFHSNDGRTASRALAWADLKMIDTPGPVELSSAASALLAQRLFEVETADARWSSALVARGISASSGEELSEAMRMRIERVTADLVAGSPTWLTTWFGSRPPDAIGATVWDDAVASVAVWRDRHGISADVPSLGAAPNDPEHQGAWRSANSAALDAHSWLANRATVAPMISIPPMPSTQIRERLAELDLLLSTAPPDCRGIVNRLVNTAVDHAELYDALVEARSGQSARHSWILTSWPYIVESEELRRMHAARPQVSEAVRRCIDWLSASDSSDSLRQLGPFAEAANAGEPWLLTALDELDQAGLLDFWSEGRIVTHLWAARDSERGLERIRNIEISPDL